MNTAWLVLITAVTLAAAAYSQYRISFHTRGRGKILFTRSLLLVVGVVFGLVMATVYIEVDGYAQGLVFLSGFGLVHVPSAAILYLKRLRGKTT
ncbi:MAG: hypothetical protein ABR544_01775 [Gammaproteobacteria bacterium]